MWSPITLESLRILDAIDRRGSFAAAADELYRVPSAISYTISKLEEDLGVDIFDRSRRKAELTAVGRLMLEQGRQILTATEELTALAREASQGWEVELRICVDTILDCASVYELIAEFQKIQPHTEVKIIEEVLGGSWDALIADRCDLVIGASSEAPVQGYETHPLGEVDFCFAVSSDHPLAQCDEPVALSAVKDYATVVVADSSRHLPARSAGLLDSRTRLVVASISQKIEAHISGLGVGYLPVHRIKNELKRGVLKNLVLEEIRSPQPIYAAWRSTRKGCGLTWFIDHVRGMQFGPDGLVAR